MLKKLKKKHLTQAVILGLLLAVPLGAQATEYNDIIYNIIGGIDEYYKEKNDKDVVIRTDNISIDTSTDPYTYTYTGTYNFDDGDQLIVRDGLMNGGAIQFQRVLFHNMIGIDDVVKYEDPKTVNFDITSLEHIEINDMKNRDQIMAISVGSHKYDNTKQFNLALGNNIIIKADSNAKYVAGIYANGLNWQEKLLAVDISMGKVIMNVDSSYNGVPQDQDLNTHKGVFGISGNYNSTITVGDGSQINVTAKGDGWLKAWGVMGQYMAADITMGKMKPESDELINGITINVNNTAALGGEAVGIYNDSDNVSLGAGSTINATLNTLDNTDDTATFVAAGVWVQDFLYSDPSVLPKVDIGNNTEINVSNKRARSIGNTGIAYGIHASCGEVTTRDNLRISTTAEGKG